MASARVKIFGERNTGTNALAQIVETNSDSRCLPSVETDLDPVARRRAASRLIGRQKRNRLFDAIFAGRPPEQSWKHCATNFDDVRAFEGVLVLITVRHPASWLVSLFKQPYHRLGPKPRRLPDFLHYPWRTVERERLGCATYTPLALYEAKMASYRTFAGQLAGRGIRHHFLRFEDLILRQEPTFRTIAADLVNPRSGFVELRESTKDRSKSLDDYRRFYSEERWRDSLVGLEAEINAAIDWPALEEFGYKPL